MRWRRFVWHHLGREAIGVGLRLRSLQVLEGLFAGFPDLGRDRLHLLVVGAVHLVHHVGAAQDAVEGDAAAQRAFTHIDAFPMCSAVSPSPEKCSSARGSPARSSYSAAYKTAWRK